MLSNPVTPRQVQLVLNEGLRPTYSVVAFNSTAPLVDQGAFVDLFLLQGSATRIVRIRQIRAWLYSNSATIIIPIYLTKRVTANTGGSFSALFPCKHATSDPDATATAIIYDPAEAPPVVGLGFDFDILPSGTPPRRFDNCRPIILVGTGESLSINTQGQNSTNGFNINMMVEWDEDISQLGTPPI